MRPLKIVIDNYIFRLAEGSLEADNSQVDYHSNTQELVLTFRYDLDLALPLPEEYADLSVELGQIEVHLPASVVRDLVERLPPEVLH